MTSPIQPSSATRHQPHVVVVAAGAAGHAAASTLRRDGYGGRLTVLHGEPDRPYNRTLVNKGVLPGLLTADQIALPALRALEVELVGTRATGLDPQTAEVVLDNGERLSYTALVVATGSPATPQACPRGGGPDPGGRVLRMHTIRGRGPHPRAARPEPAAASVTLLGAGFMAPRPPATSPTLRPRCTCSPGRPWRWLPPSARAVTSSASSILGGLGRPLRDVPVVVGVPPQGGSHRGTEADGSEQDGGCSWLHACCWARTVPRSGLVAMVADGAVRGQVQAYRRMRARTITSSATPSP